MKIKVFCMVVLCTCLFIACEKGDDEVFDPIKPPVEQPEKPVDPEQPEEPERPVTPPSINDIINVKIGDLNMIVGNNNWQLVVNAGGKYIAADNKGYITTSTNGTSWSTPKQIATGVTNTKCIAYGGGKYVAFVVVDGDSNYVTTSSDGVTWSAPTQPNVAKGVVVTAVAYINGAFFAGSGVAKIFKSTDGGVTWTQILDDSSRKIGAVACDLEHNTIVFVGSRTCIYSKDGGQNWTVTYPFELPSISGVYSVAYGDGVWCSTTEDRRVAYTTDLTTWTSVLLPADVLGSTMRGITYGNGKFVAISSYYSSSGYIGYSTDGGKTWQSAKDMIPDFPDAPRGICAMS